MRDAGQNTFLVCGGVLAVVGAVFTGIGVWMFNNMDFVRANGTGDVDALPFVFSLIGVVLLICGSALLIHLIVRSGAKRRLLENGQHITAEITGVVPDFNIRRNRFPTYKVECSYLDQTTGLLHVFYSKNLARDPSDYLKGATVRVYVNKQDRNYKDYYVDIDPLLPETRMH